MEADGPPGDEGLCEVLEVLVVVLCVEGAQSLKGVLLLLFAREVIPLLRAHQDRLALHVCPDTLYAVVLFLASPEEQSELFLIEIALFALFL